METAISVALVGFAGSLLVAVSTYWFSKQRDLDAEHRKEKLAYYKAFVESLSGIVDGDSSAEGHLAFARSTNNLLLFAPQSVLAAVTAFRSEISMSNAPNRTQEKHDRFLAQMLFAIRVDVGVVPADDHTTFQPMVWSSGAKKASA